MDRASIVYSSPFTDLAGYWALCPQSGHNKSREDAVVIQSTHQLFGKSSLLLSLNLDILPLFNFHFFLIIFTRFS